MMNNKIMLWKKNADIILDNHSNKKAIKTIFFELLNYIEKKEWEGSCHATASIIYVLFSELGLNPKLYVGEVLANNIAFSHSWIEESGNIYDVSIYLGLNGVKVYPPVLMNCDIDSTNTINVIYGSDKTELDDVAANILKMTLVDYMNLFPNFSKGLWYLVEEIGDKVGLNIEIDILKDKYKDVYWNRK